MLVKDVAELPPIERLLYWIEERHAVFLRRKVGNPKPWTDDEVLQSVFFTNPYREHDKTTVWFRENVRDPLRDDPRVLFATICFRWFNLIATGYHLKNNDLLTEWDQRKAVRILSELRKMGRSVFTGAFMIPAVPGTKKIEHVCDCLQPIWQNRKQLVEEIKDSTLQNAHENLTLYSYLGNFMAYEVVTDLRFTYLLGKAIDRLTWCNPGPGCIRGLYRLSGAEIKSKSNATSPPKPKDWQEQMIKMLKTTQRR